jgi:SAM-dependent methyltransferase/glycosyltransferase involved in cell wall biosynthesis
MEVRMPKFKLPVDTDGIQQTSERFHVGQRGEIEFEHYHRYLFASQFCNGRDVLDVACGEGYGGFLLSQVARSVVGIDIDNTVVEYAAKTYGSDKLGFAQGSCLRIPAPDQSFAVVVSFETIEHIREHDQFLLEVRRVLRPDGVFILSTPDRDVYSAPDKGNPFHLLELTRSEFRKTLAQQFSFIEMATQKVTAGSVVMPDRRGPVAIQIFHKADVRTYTHSHRLRSAPFLLAVASNSKTPEIQWGLLDCSTFISEQHQEIERRDLDIQELIGQLHDRDRRLVAADGDLRRLMGEIEDRERRLEAADCELRRLMSDVEKRDRLLTLADVDLRRDDIAADCALLEQSGMVDPNAYRVRAGCDINTSAAEHYLVHGWKLGIEPKEDFEGSFLYPYFRTIGLDGPPAITFIGLSAAGWITYPSRAQAESLAALIRDSGLFDAESYATRLRLPANVDPALHYIIVGEQAGYAPSNRFDPVFYGERYPDVRAARVSYLAHYITNGRGEQRRAVSIASNLSIDGSLLDPDREIVLLVSHEASRTGAPILAYNVAAHLRGRYNVITVLLRGGPLFEDFGKCSAVVIAPFSYDDWHEAEAIRLVERLNKLGRISYAIVNSIESRWVMSSLVKEGIPVVSLVHEFASYTQPQGAMSEALEWATQMVFSADITAKSAVQELPTLSNRTIHILTQGHCLVPGARQATAPDSLALRSTMLPKGREDALVVLGGGAIQIRKGVDVFLACAASVMALAPKRPVRFVWIGQGYDPANDANYSSYLAEQIARSGLGETVAIVDEVADLGPAYATAGIFFLSSRLDPFPNVTIDAALSGLPIVCFEGGSGIASLLDADATLRKCVVPYLDAHAAACVIAELADNESERVRISQAMRRFGEATFNMERYVVQIDTLGRQSIEIMRQRANDLATVEHDPLFDADFFMPHNSPIVDRIDAINDFLTRWTAVGTSPHSVRNSRFRRPFPGFNPQIYAHNNVDRFDSALVNPLAHFIRSGKPDGPWCHDVILPFEEAPAVSPRQCSAALHAHFFYPELAPDLLQRLAANQAHCDLMLTTTDDEKATALRAATSDYRMGTVTISIVPNRGRDIGAFLSGFGRERLARYDVVGHVHAKRSLLLGDTAGETWREFLWQNLVGDQYAMMDTVLARFAAEPGLGLVFPEDPHLPGWSDNLKIASSLAERLGLTEPLELFFEFPLGTMFWARSSALTPLFDLDLGWDDYPEEPVPYDGTMLHALERLLPFVARRTGYDYATTHIPGVSR